MTIKLISVTRPQTAQIGDRVEIAVTIENNDSWGIIYDCGISVLDQAGIPFVVWDEITNETMGYKYESPVVFFMLMPNQPCTFHGHYFQGDQSYPADIRLHWRDANSPYQTPFNTEPDIYQFTVESTLYHLSLEVQVGGGQGKVFSDDTSYLSGSQAHIWAQADPGYEFDYWELTFGETIKQKYYAASVIFTMADNVVAKGYFHDTSVTPTYYTLTVQKSGGNGTVTGAKEVYTPGETATLTAQPASGYDFVKWIVSGQTFTTRTISFVMNANKLATVYFKPAGTTPPPDPDQPGFSGIGLVFLLALAVIGLSGDKK